MYNNEQKNEENFWISYADLMAGLLFVFILVIKAIVIKYLYTQNNLEREKQALNLSQEEILNKNSALRKIEDEKAKLFYELAQARNIYEETKTKLDSANTSLDEKAKSISLNLAEIEKLKALLLEFDLKTKEQTDTNEKLSAEILNRQNVISLKDEELALLADKLLVQTQIHQKMVEEFDITKVKIKNLTGIKLNVIAKLREKLGKSINIDEKEIYCGIDVVSVEPILESNPLLKVKNKERLLLTPHIGWASIEARTKLISLVASNIKEFIS